MRPDLIAASSVLPTRPLVAERPSAPVFDLPELPGTAGAPQAHDNPAEALPALVAQANRALKENGSELALEFNDDLGRSVFKLIDSTTGEVLRQIPSEQALAVARALAQGQSAGALLDEQV